MAQTTIIVTNSGSEFNIPGLLSVQQVVSSYGESIPGLAGFNSEVEDDDDGNRTITFSARTGTKGAMLQSTTIIVTNSGSEFVVPGLLSVQQVVSAYAESIPGLSGFSSEVNDDDEDHRVITFSPRTGTKG